MKKLLAVLFLVALATPALAQDKPIFSLERVALGAGADYRFYHVAADQELPLNVNKEWTVGLYAAYSMTPHLALAAAEEYGMDSKLWMTRVGIRVRLYQGRQ